MTKAELWKIFLQKNPSFSSETIVLPAKGLKKLFDTTYDQGYNQGKSESPMNFMEGIFGK